MTADETVAQAVTFLLAGTDTTSQTMAYALYSLAVNPEVQSKLEGEIRDCLEQSKVSCHGTCASASRILSLTGTHISEFSEQYKNR